MDFSTRPILAQWFDLSWQFPLSHQIPLMPPRPQPPPPLPYHPGGGKQKQNSSSFWKPKNLPETQ